jgi:UDP-2,3-diacylglucosamine pyrophosphatase LpxH
MLALVSDIHFCDGTAIQGNVAPGVFALTLREVYDIALEIARVRDRPTHVDVVLLGDIFDLLRTERWFEDARGTPVPLAERPWGSARAVGATETDPAVVARARSILGEILAKNAESLAALRGEATPPPPGVEVRRIYIPGNHDRLFLHDDTLRAGILGALGAVDGQGLEREGIFLHHLEMPEYALIARHGHEWDCWNFPEYRADTPASAYTDEDYLPTPIGDAVTAELAVRLPYELRRLLVDSRSFSPELAARVADRFHRIEDVRPLFASFHWAYYAVRALGAELGGARARDLEVLLDDTLRSLVRRFKRLEFYEAWEERHHQPFHLDPALLLRVILRGLSGSSWFPTHWIARQVERVLAKRNPIPATRRGARREELTCVSDREMRFVVYGHTHGFELRPMRAGPLVQDVYFNTGTYRPGVFRTDDGEGFVGWQRFGYVCLMSADEAVSTETPFGFRNVGPAFVAWAGARSAGAMSRAGREPIR